MTNTNPRTQPDNILLSFDNALFSDIYIKATLEDFKKQNNTLWTIWKPGENTELKFHDDILIHFLRTPNSETWSGLKSDICEKVIGGWTQSFNEFFDLPENNLNRL